jgi:hypothetical protein
MRRKRSTAEAAAPARRPKSEHFLLKLGCLFLAIGGGAFFLSTHPLSQTRYVILAVTGLCILAFLFTHSSNGRALLVVLFEYAAVATLVVTLMGGLAPAPSRPAQHAKGKNHQAARTDAGFDPARIGAALGQACRKAPPCDAFQQWLAKNRKALAGKTQPRTAHKPASQPARKAKG